MQCAGITFDLRLFSNKLEKYRWYCYCIIVFVFVAIIIADIAIVIVIVFVVGSVHNRSDLNCTIVM